MRQLLTYLFFTLLFFGHSHAQEYIVNVQQFGVNEGLGGRDVGNLFIDINGFLWIAGNDYLQRYDGYEFRMYDLKGDKGKVHIIHLINQEKDGWLRLMVGYKVNPAQADLLYFDPATGEVISKTEKLDEPFSSQLDLLFDSHYYSLSYRENGSDQVYFSGAKHIIKCNFTNQRLDTIPYSLPDNKKISLKYIDSKSNYWGSPNLVTNTLLKLNPEGKVEFIIKPDNEKKWSHISMFEWKDHLYFIGKNQANIGLGINNKERSKKGQDYLYKLNEDGNLDIAFEAPFGYNIFKFFDDRIWCINEEGWKVFDMSGNLDFTLNRKDYKDGLFDMFNVAVFTKDKLGKIYFGTAFGLNIIETQENSFTQYMSDSKDVELPIENSARGIYDTGDEVVINLEFGGLITIPKLNPDSFYLHATHSTDPSNYKGMYAGRPMVRDAEGNYWIAEIGYIRKWSSDFQKEEKLYLQKYDDVWSMHIDESGCIWIGGNVIIGKICKGDSFITEFTREASGIKAEKFCIYQIQDFNKTKLWLCTENGLYVFDKTTNKTVAHYHVNAANEFSLPANYVYCMHIDMDNNRWLGTRSGLVFWDSKTNEKRLFTRNNGLSNNVIYAIKEDDYGRLWLSSDYGIMSFDKNTFKVNTYLEKDGISHHEFNRTSHHQSEDGTIYFGGLNGVTAFHPKDFIGEQKNYPAIAIADYEIFDGSKGKLLNKTKELTASKTITLHPSDRYFKLKFVLPTFDKVNKILYAWKMEGVYEDWTYQKENTLQFSALPYGNHKLRIKGQGVSGGWSPHELVVQVKVLKPFYLQTWFLASSLLFCIFAIWRYNAFRINKLRKDKANLELKINEATEEIQAANIKMQEDKKFIELQAEELKKLDKLKSRFFSNISHELRTPLSLMIGPIKHLLKNNTHSEKDKLLLEFIKRNSLHLKSLVNEILDLSKLENNKMELKEEPVAFYQFVNDHMAQFYSFGNSESISFSTSFSSNQETTILLDKNKFEKIINNFLSNAMKFTPPGGKVYLSVKEESDQLHLMVKDTGRGIHPDDLPKVFDRFYQSSQADAPTEGGTGIGLSLCWELAELMGGKVWAESVLDVGSTFHFRFPKKQTKLQTKQSGTAKGVSFSDEELDTATQEMAATTISQKKKYSEATILIAEDNEDLRAYYKIILSDYKIVLTENGQEALSYLQQTKQTPNLIISDLMMPVMDGMQFLTRLKSEEQWRHIPVIMLTAKANKITKLKALRIGIDDYMTKPFDEEELQVRVHNLLLHQKERFQESKEENGKPSVETQLNTESLFSEEDMTWLEEVENFVKDHIDDNRLSVNFLVEKFHMSNSTLLRKLRKLTGLTPVKYIQEHRLVHARSLLENRTYSTISKVALSVGFRDTHSFSRSFKQRFGVKPSEVMAG